MTTVEWSGSDRHHRMHSTGLQQRQRFLRLNRSHGRVVTSAVFSWVQTFQKANFRVCEVMPTRYDGAELVLQENRGICKRESALCFNLALTHRQAEKLTLGANRLNSSFQLCNTLRGQTMRNGASTRTRKYAINAIVWRVYRMNNQGVLLKGSRQLRDCLYEPCPAPSHPLDSDNSIKSLTTTIRSMTAHPKSRKCHSPTG